MASTNSHKRPMDMSDKELMNAFYTHPQRMVGSILHRHDNVHRQLAAFAELLRRVEAHYASDHLRQMLCAVCVGVPDLPRRPGKQRNHEAQPDDVTSLAQLRRLVSGLRSAAPRRGGIQREEQRAIVNYFENFFDDLDELRDIKRYFHERIYACLYEHYYQPDNDDSMSPTSTIVPDGRDGSGRPLATVLDQSDNDAPSSLEGRPLSEIVQQLWILNRDWDVVLEDKYPVEVDDEPPQDEQRFVAITLIVPTWVEFGFKALQLAKVWWTTANRIYSEKPPPLDASRHSSRSGNDQRSVPEEIDDENEEAASLKEEVSTLDDCAYQISVEMYTLREELGQVRKHGERVEGLYRKLKEAEKQERVAQKSHDDIVAQTKSPEADSADLSILKQLDRASMELEVAQYRVKLIQGDLDLETGIRFGDGRKRAPLEHELQALEEQLERTLSAKQAAEDRLQSVMEKRTSSRESEDRGRGRQRFGAVDLTRENRIDSRSSNSAGFSHKSTTSVSAKRVQRI